MTPYKEFRNIEISTHFALNDEDGPIARKRSSRTAELIEGPNRIIINVKDKQIVYDIDSTIDTPYDWYQQKYGE